MSKQRKLETLHAFQATGVGILSAGKLQSEIDAGGLLEDLLPEQAELRQELTRRILHSESFRSAEMLQQLLLYLIHNANGSDGGALKEYSIGVEALGRRTDFDPTVDPIVRVQMHRLRQKLREYHSHQGAGDPLVLEIPKGQYLATFRKTEIPAASEAAIAQPDLQSLPVAMEHPPAVVHSSAQAETVGWRRGRMSIPLIVGAFLCGLVAAFLGMKLAGIPASSGPVQAFWSQFLGNDRSPIIGYPDAVFLLDDSNDLFRFRQGATDQRGSLVTQDIVQQFAANPVLATKAGPLYYENGYTGTGELESAAMVSGLFATMGVRPTIKSSRDITTADFEQHDVILLGSPFQNPAVAQLPVTGDFVVLYTPATATPLRAGQSSRTGPCRSGSPFISRTCGKQPKTIRTCSKPCKSLDRLFRQCSCR